jgi:nitrogen PTS system EIIA component
MDLADLIEPSSVIFDARASNKEQLLLALAARAATCLNLNPKMVFNALQAREQLGSTGLGEGFALPHARIEGLDRFFGMFARLRRAIQFDSVDDKPVDLIFLLLIPLATPNEHVAALATIAWHMRDKEFATKLRKATSAAALAALLCDPLSQRLRVEIGFDPAAIFSFWTDDGRSARA